MHFCVLPWNTIQRSDKPKEEKKDSGKTKILENTLRDHRETEPANTHRWSDKAKEEHVDTRWNMRLISHGGNWRRKYKSGGETRGTPAFTWKSPEMVANSMTIDWGFFTSTTLLDSTRFRYQGIIFHYKRVISQRELSRHSMAARNCT